MKANSQNIGPRRNFVILELKQLKIRQPNIYGYNWLKTGSLWLKP